MSDVEEIEAVVEAWIQGKPSGPDPRDDGATLILALLGKFNRLERETRAKAAEEIAADIETRIRTWEGMSDQAQAGNENLRQAARIAREHGKES